MEKKYSSKEDLEEAIKTATSWVKVEIVETLTK